MLSLRHLRDVRWALVLGGGGGGAVCGPVTPTRAPYTLAGFECQSSSSKPRSISATELYWIRAETTSVTCSYHWSSPFFCDAATSLDDKCPKTTTATTTATTRSARYLPKFLTGSQRKLSQTQRGASEWPNMQSAPWHQMDPTCNNPTCREAVGIARGSYPASQKVRAGDLSADPSDLPSEV